ncbi:MAG TPA: hypothetical protein DD637_01355, partial [Verrucomicrobia bacterium]|nr:hypothetical protein [Verrucomicrobiota bacterium]
MKSILFLFALLLCAFPVLSAPWEDVTAARYPDADAVVVEAAEDYAYQPDGTYIATEKAALKILTEKGRREEHVQRFAYSKRYSALGGPYVSIIGTNGVRRTVDISATMREATDNSSTSANIYDPLDRV